MTEKYYHPILKSIYNLYIKNCKYNYLQVNFYDNNSKNINYIIKKLISPNIIKRINTYCILEIELYNPGFNINKELPKFKVVNIIDGERLKLMTSHYLMVDDIQYFYLKIYSTHYINGVDSLEEIIRSYINFFMPEEDINSLIQEVDNWNKKYADNTFHIIKFHIHNHFINIDNILDPLQISKLLILA